MLLAGCVILEEEKQEVEEEQPKEVNVPQPTIKITSPLNGENIISKEGRVTVIIQTENILLRNPGGAKKEGEGHLKISVDGKEIATTSNKIYELTLEPGEHTISVELLHNDGYSYYPKVMDSVVVTVGEPEPQEYEPKTYEIVLNNTKMEPQEITIKRTDYLKFINKGTRPLSIVADSEEGMLFTTKVLANGESEVIQVNEVGEFRLISPLSPVVNGQLIVEES